LAQKDCLSNMDQLVRERCLQVEGDQDFHLKPVVLSEEIIDPKDLEVKLTTSAINRIKYLQLRKLQGAKEQS